jgi:hypothetical protein
VRNTQLTKSVGAKKKKNIERVERLEFEKRVLYTRRKRKKERKKERKERF